METVLRVMEKKSGGYGNPNGVVITKERKRNEKER
jgi:hypothetical protein